MIKSAIEKILGLSAPTITEHDGIEYADRQLFPIKPPQPARLEIKSLSGLVDYVRACTKQEERNNLVIHAEGPDSVYLLTKLDMIFQTRDCLAHCSLFEDRRFTFGQFMDVENFIISLQSHFVQTETSKKILQIVGNIKCETVQTSEDDGTTQRVAAKQGTVMVKEVSVPNPVSLKPFRTFRELDQPESAFVLRVKSDSGRFSCALFEADGSEWKLDAMARIKTYLEKEIKDIAIIA